ncbi:MAG: hypothetical protein CML44_02630 [Rhodobacteraceae bacterium]|nr:hypothetical protein [Paracoccaceae bacterium]|tara:strand:+ start:391 stop:849 length:459 start_codon:yes stop_codon:yes gene_type:complete
MDNEIDWERFSDPTIISARTLILIVLGIEIVLQSVALAISPTEWWIWQLLGFITATNLGAVVLAVLAQRSANNIGKAYKKVFTPSFYKTVNMFSKFQEYFELEAQKEGRDLDEEIKEVAPKLWGVIRAHLDVKEPMASLQPLDKQDDTDLFD